MDRLQQVLHLHQSTSSLSIYINIYQPFWFNFNSFQLFRSCVLWMKVDIIEMIRSNRLMIFQLISGLNLIEMYKYFEMSWIFVEKMLKLLEGSRRPKTSIQKSVFSPRFFLNCRSSQINVCGRIFGIPWRNAVCDGEKAYIEVSVDFWSLERYYFEKKPNENSYRMQIFTVKAQGMNGGCGDGFQAQRRTFALLTTTTSIVSSKYMI
jgi:hypothetical protein